MWLILISDGYLYQHYRKGFNFQQTWGLQTHTTVQPFRLSRQSYLIPSLVFRVWRKLLLSYVRFMEPTSRAQWLRDLGKESVFSSIVLKLSSAIVSWSSSTFCVGCQNAKNGCYVAEFGQGKHLMKACLCWKKWVS